MFSFLCNLDKSYQLLKTFNYPTTNTVYVKEINKYFEIIIIVHVKRIDIKGDLDVIRNSEFNKNIKKKNVIKISCLKNTVFFSGYFKTYEIVDWFITPVFLSLRWLYAFLLIDNLSVISCSVSTWKYPMCSVKLICFIKVLSAAESEPKNGRR